MHDVNSEELPPLRLKKPQPVGSHIRRVRMDGQGLKQFPKDGITCLVFTAMRFTQTMPQYGDRNTTAD